jgi:hypothetical protein
MDAASAAYMSRIEMAHEKRNKDTDNFLVTVELQN